MDKTIPPPPRRLLERGGRVRKDRANEGFWCREKKTSRDPTLASVSTGGGGLRGVPWRPRGGPSGPSSGAPCPAAAPSPSRPMGGEGVSWRSGATGGAGGDDEDEGADLGGEVIDDDHAGRQVRVTGGHIVVLQELGFCANKRGGARPAFAPNPFTETEGLPAGAVAIK